MFPRKMVFEKNSVRTLEMNRVVSLILNAEKTSGGSKNKKANIFVRFFARGAGGDRTLVQTMNFQAFYMLIS